MKNLAGRLNRRVELWRHKETESTNILGQTAWEEEKIKTLWAEVRPQTGSLLSRRIADTNLSRTTHKITIRYTDGITPDMWIMARGERYNIIYILNPYLKNETLELFCEVVI